MLQFFTKDFVVVLGLQVLLNWERANTKIKPEEIVPTNFYVPFTFVFPTILDPGVVSLPAWEIDDVLVPRPPSYAPHSPHSRSLRFSKRKRKPCWCTAYEFYKKLGLEHVSNISQKTSNSLSDYQPKGYLKRHNLIHLFFNQAFSKFIIHKQRPRILQFLSYE